MRILKRALRILAVFLIVLSALVYAGDYAFLRYEIGAKRDVFAKITTDSYYAVPRKDGRLEFMFNDPVDQQCIQSLFPHLGYQPCWYVKRRRDNRINL
jgi:hypothetical protein